MELNTLFASTVVAALVSALVSFLMSERKILIENVTNERAKWRIKIKEISASLISAVDIGDFSTVASLRMQLALNMNPFDKDDQEILASIDELANRPEDSDALLKETTERLSLLLKHDWERAKSEAKPWFGRTNRQKRISYSEYKRIPISMGPIEDNSAHRLEIIGSLLLMLFTVALMFFLAVGMLEPFKDLVRLFNDPLLEKTATEWVWFVLISLVASTSWLACYLGFQWGEKRFLELWSAE